MKKYGFLLSAIIGAVFFISCKGDSTALMKKATGKPGETVIVIGSKYWEGLHGDTISKLLAYPQLGLPQEEPVLDLISIPHSAFTNVFKTCRNIIITKIAPSVTEPGVKVLKNVWAAPQVVINIQAPDESSFTELFSKSSDLIASTFIKAEKKRLMDTYKDRKFQNKLVLNTVKSKYGLTINVPKGYIIAKDTTDFLWVKYETPHTSQGLFIYKYLYRSDSTFTAKYILDRRDSVLRKYVSGPSANSWMTSERQVDPTLKTLQLNGNYTAETRGLWKVKGDFMGGPYVSLTTLSPDKQCIITAEGYVYAPKYNKREYLRQLEAMIYSVSFPSQ